MGTIEGLILRDRTAPSAVRIVDGALASRAGLKVVMIVANDLTRDSRVLREATSLAADGHSVTVLGIMTARTEAPETEFRAGFVIRRLPFRARPPGWWIPPDFYARIRYRAGRQYRIHRARVKTLLARVRRRDLTRRLRTRRGVGWARVVVHWQSLAARWSPRRGPGQPLSTASRVGSRTRYICVRASRTAPWRWPSKALALARRARSERHSGPPAGRFSAEGPGAQMYLARGALAYALGSTRIAGKRLAVTWSTVSRPVARALSAWSAIATMLLWGTLFLGANRASRGAIDWMTGWRWRWYGWARFLLEHAPDADVWHGHDMTSLPAVVALKRARGGLAVYDSHEIYLESARHAEQPAWAKASLAKLERDLVREVDAVITVNDSVAEVLAHRLQRPDVRVLYNCPARARRTGRSLLREHLQLPATTPLILYHGSLAPHRGVEELLAAIQRPELREVHLAFLGFGALMAWLAETSRERRFEGRVHTLDAVPPDDLPAWLAGVDVAVAPIQASTLNHRLSSPNKVFEAICAGAPVAGSDFPEFRRVIYDAEFGPLGETFDPARPDDIARAVRRILDLPPEDRAKLRTRCLRASDERWNWETEARQLTSLYAGLRAKVANVRVRAA